MSDPVDRRRRVEGVAAVALVGVAQIAEPTAGRRCSHIVRAIAVCMLAASTACAASPSVGSEVDEPVPNVLITLTEATHPGSWPTARAELRGAAGRVLSGPDQHATVDRRAEL